MSCKKNWCVVGIVMFVVFFNDQVVCLEVFLFGDLMEVFDWCELFDYVECMCLGKWFELLLLWDGLVWLFCVMVYYCLVIYVKCNILVSMFILYLLFLCVVFECFVFDWQVFGNVYLEN